MLKRPYENIEVRIARLGNREEIFVLDGYNVIDY